jgi:hypothetical protein
MGLRLLLRQERQQLAYRLFKMAVSFVGRGLSVVSPQPAPTAVVTTKKISEGIKRLSTEDDILITNESGKRIEVT